jgi:hypothetical protein
MEIGDRQTRMPPLLLCRAEAAGTREEQGVGVGCTTMLLSQRQCGGAAWARGCHWAGSRTKASGSARQETTARRKTHAPWIFEPTLGLGLWTSRSHGRDWIN